MTFWVKRRRTTVLPISSCDCGFGSGWTLFSTFCRFLVGVETSRWCAMLATSICTDNSAISNPKIPLPINYDFSNQQSHSQYSMHYETTKPPK